MVGAGPEKLPRSLKRGALRPAMPAYPPRGLSPFKSLRLARRNVVGIWRPEAFAAPFLARKFMFRWMYVANNPDAVRHVMVTNTDNYWKSPAMQAALRPLVGNGSFISNGKTWQRQRRLLTPAFHHRRIKLFSRYMAAQAQAMVEAWAARGAGAEIDTGFEMAQATARVVCRAMFSKDIGDEIRPIFDAFTDYCATLHQIDYAEMLGLPGFMTQRPVGRAVRAAGVINKVLRTIVADRWGESQDRGDYVSSLLTARDDATGQGLSETEIRDEMSVIFLAGHETTATTLTWALYLLAQDRDIEARLHAEVDKVLAGRIATYEDHDKLPFTRAVIEETLRLFPPVPLFSRQTRAHDSIDGFDIEPGSNMIVCPWLLHRHRLLWDAPNSFVPERFLRAGRGHRKYAYIPFGAGPRTCIGVAFGQIETTILLSTIAQRFRLRLPRGHQVTPVARLTLRPSPGVPMILEPRERSA